MFRCRKWVGCMVVIVATALSLMGCGTKEAATLKALAKSKSQEVQMVYIAEQGEYVPYLVLSGDYDGKVLLLREQVLPELMPFKEHSDLWRHDEYGSYYEQSSLDAYLKQEFLDRFAEPVRGYIADTTIEVTDLTAYDEWNYATHTIERKVFLLSSVEMGVKGLDGYTTTTEGEALDYFTNKEMAVKKAYDSEGNALPYWTRTPELWESCTVVVIGTEVVGNTTADLSCGVRPAFCMQPDTEVHRSDKVIEGESVYIVE